MAISFVAESHTHNYYASSSLQVDKPSGTANGDVLIAVVGGTRSGSPSGWTLLGSAASGVGSLGTVYVYYKVAASEGTRYTFSTNGSTWDNWASVSAYRGVDNTTPVDTSHFQVEADSGSNYNVGPVTVSGTQWAFSFAMHYSFGQGSGGSWSEGGGAFERGETSDYRNSESSSYMVCDSNGLVPSGSYSRTQTCSISTSGGVKGLLLLNQAGGGTTLASAPLVVARGSVIDPDAVNVGVGADAGTATATAAAADPSPIIGRYVTAGSALVVAGTPDVGRHAAAGMAAAAVEVEDPHPFLGTPSYRTGYVPAETRTKVVTYERRVHAIPADEPL